MIETTYQKILSNFTNFTIQKLELTNKNEDILTLSFFLSLLLINFYERNFSFHQKKTNNFLFYFLLSLVNIIKKVFFIINPKRFSFINTPKIFLITNIILLLKIEQKWIFKKYWQKNIFKLFFFTIIFYKVFKNNFQHNLFCSIISAFIQIIRKPFFLKKNLRFIRIIFGPVFWIMIFSAFLKILFFEKNNLGFFCIFFLILATCFSFLAGTFFRPDNHSLLKIYGIEEFFEGKNILKLHGILNFTSFLIICIIYIFNHLN